MHILGACSVGKRNSQSVINPSISGFVFGSIIPNTLYIRIDLGGLGGLVFPGRFF
jgi:hypothetical protein